MSHTKVKENHWSTGSVGLDLGRVEVTRVSLKKKNKGSDPIALAREEEKSDPGKGESASGQSQLIMSEGDTKKKKARGWSEKKTPRGSILTLHD